MATRRLKAHLGMNIIRCDISMNGRRCYGFQRISVSRGEFAKMRAGNKTKAVEANFSCSHRKINKIILEA